MSIPKRLGVAFIGSGFMTRFHIGSWRAVRDADIVGLWSPNARHAADTAAYARSLGVGPARPYRSITELVADPAVDALWICGPNHRRVENLEEIVAALEARDTERAERLVREHTLRLRDHVERFFRESMISRLAPVSPQLVLSFIAEKVLGLPKSY